jgi:hypothetical protein
MVAMWSLMLLTTTQMEEVVRGASPRHGSRAAPVPTLGSVVRVVAVLQRQLAQRAVVAVVGHH